MNSALFYQWIDTDVVGMLTTKNMFTEAYHGGRLHRVVKNLLVLS